MQTDIRVDPRLLKSPVETRIETVANLATALDLGDSLSLEFDLYKASKAERITAPHLVPIIWQLEKEFYALFDSRKIIERVLEGIGVDKKLWKAISRKIYKTDGTPMTEAEMQRLEKLLSDALKVSTSKVRELILKGTIAGKLSGFEPMGKPLGIKLSNLPTTLKDAISILKLTEVEIRSVQWAWQLAALHVTRVQERGKYELKRMIIEGMINRTPPRRLAQKLFHEAASKDEGFLNRDWERIALTEINEAHSNGFISSIPEGDYVVGISHDDACQYCRRLIHHKVYMVTHDLPLDYSSIDPESKEYKRTSQIWDTRIWVGKTNFGRSLANRKRLNGTLKNRDHHERSMPTIPLHPSCRCTWNKWMKDLNYIRGGRIEFAIDEKTRKERNEWLKKNPHIS